MPTLRLVGPGRAGTALARGLAGAGWDVASPRRRDDDVADAAAGVDLLVLSTPDHAVAGVAAEVAPVPGTVVAHLAGSLGLDVLAPHPRRAAVHPLVSIPVPETDLRGACFAVAGDEMARRVVEALGGRSVAVADDDRAAYHAAACVASNHLVALLGSVERIAASAGVPLAAYLDLVRQTVDNVAALGPAAALTGPVRRGDTATVERHLAALDPSERAAYEALAGAARRLVPDAGSGAVRVIERVAELTAALEAERAGGRTVGLVPTMGALHDGHASLVERSAAENDVTCLTIFVNPLQFGAGEDLAAYPRDLDGDVRMAEKAGAGLVFAPSTEEMAAGPTRVRVTGLDEVLEGPSRPGHLEGVATVVARPFAMAGRCRAYFGEKDFQQLVIVDRLARDLRFPVEVVGCATVREPDGLAMSSRNAYLSPAERAAAPVLLRALLAGASSVLAGERDPVVVRDLVAAVVEAEPLAALDHADVVDPATLVTPSVLAGELRLLVAARFGRARLIDNLGVKVP